MKFIFTIIILSIVACASTKVKSIMINGKILIHEPYCGGAKPSKDIARGKFHPYKMSTFYIKNEIDDKNKKIKTTKITTDINGEFKLELPLGKYVLYHEDKTLSFEQYLAKYNIPKHNFEFIGEKEAKIEYETPDLNFVVEENKPIELTYHSKCFVGLNPCMRYTGPKPQ